MFHDQGIVIDSTHDYSVLIGKLHGVDAIITGRAGLFTITNIGGTAGGNLVTDATAQLIALDDGQTIASVTYSHDVNAWGSRKSPTEVGQTLADELVAPSVEDGE